jgi:hypothetical protein
MAPGAVALSSSASAAAMTRICLLFPVMRQTQDVAERKFDGERAGHADLLSPVGHIGDHHSGHPGAFKRTCQHGHVGGALRSGSGEQDAIHAVRL